MNKSIEMKETMTSSALGLMLGYKKEDINKKVRLMFSDKIATEIISAGLDSQNRVKEYYLPELESKMFVAKHDINYLEVITQYWIDKNPVSRAIEAQPVQEIAPSSQTDSFMALDLMTKALNLPESGKLTAYAIGMQDYPRFVQALPKYAVDKPIIGNFVESDTTGSAQVTHSMSYFVKDLGLDISTQSINKLLVSFEFLEVKTRSSRRGPVKFKAVTEAGLRFGKNLISPDSPNQTQPHWFDSSILELLEAIGVSHER